MPILRSARRPSYQQGFARSAAESAYPQLWSHFAASWATSLGPTGLRVIDSSGHHRDGTINGATAEQFWNGQSAVLDGSDDYVEVGSDWLQDGSNYTLALSLKTDVVNQYKAAFSRYSGNDDSVEVFVLSSGNRLGIGQFQSAAMRIEYSPISTGTWYRVVLSVSDGNGIAWVNGINAGSYSDLHIETLTGAGAIGRRSSGSYHFDGEIRDVMWWNRSMSSAEAMVVTHDPLAPFRLRRRTQVRVVSGGSTWTATASLAAGAAGLVAAATFTPPTYTATASPTAAGPQVTASATHTAPTYTATASPIVAGAQGSATATHTTPTYTATAAPSAAGSTIAASAQFTAPVYTATAAPTAAGSTLAASATFAQDTYTATASPTVAAATGSATATFTAPVYTGTAALTSAGSTASASATFATNTYAATAAVQSGGATLSSSATFTAPVYTASAAVTAAGSTFAASATFAAEVTTAGFIVVQSASISVARATGTISVPSATATIQV